MELQEYLRTLRKRWKTISLVLFLTVLISGAVTIATPKAYVSNAQLFVATSGSSSDIGNVLTGAQFSSQRVKTYTQLVKMPQVLAPVSAALGYEVTKEEVTATSPLDTVLINIAVSNHDPARAIAIADAVSIQLAKVIQELETPLSVGGSSPVKATVVQQASTPDGPSSPRPVSNVILGILLGALLGVGIAILLETLDNTVKAFDDVVKATGINPIGIIGFDPGAKSSPIAALNQRSVRSEAFRTLRTNLQFVDVDKPPHVFVISSALPDEGKSTTCLNLAIAFAQSGAKVCLVDADLRKPSLAGYLGIDGGLGLTNILAGQVKLEDALVLWNRELMTVLPSGPTPPNPSELLGSKQMSALLEQLRKEFDYVIIDGAPLLPVTDSAILGRLTDGIIFVVRFGKTTHEQIQRTIESLAIVEAHLLGPVVNFVPSGSAGYGYGYGYGYGLQDSVDISDKAVSGNTE